MWYLVILENGLRFTPLVSLSNGRWPWNSQMPGMKQVIGHRDSKNYGHFGATVKFVHSPDDTPWLLTGCACCSGFWLIWGYFSIAFDKLNMQSLVEGKVLLAGMGELIIEILWIIQKQVSTVQRCSPYILAMLTCGVWQLTLRIRDLRTLRFDYGLFLTEPLALEPVLLESNAEAATGSKQLQLWQHTSYLDYGRVRWPEFEHFLGAGHLVAFTFIIAHHCAAAFIKVFFGLCTGWMSWDCYIECRGETLRSTRQDLWESEMGTKRCDRLSPHVS